MSDNPGMATPYLLINITIEIFFFAGDTSAALLCPNATWHWCILPACKKLDFRRPARANTAAGHYAAPSAVRLTNLSLRSNRPTCFQPFRHTP